MNPALAAALARMDAALGRLETGMGRHFDADARRSDLETELQVMGDDRQRLATELESAAARVNQLESATDHVGARLGVAIEQIQDILAAEIRLQPGQALMASVQVTIAGRAYRMACGDGEEAHLEALAAAFDQKIAEMRQAFGEIGDMRLHVMAALMTADELSELRRRIEGLESELAAMRSVALSSTERQERTERQLAEALNRSAERIETLASRFGPRDHAAD